MTVSDRHSVVSVNWWEAEPHRFARDQAEVTARFPDLRWVAEDSGRWEGRLPMWPVDRPQPPGLTELLGGRGMTVVIVYRQAYPMVAPRIYPVDPRPEPLECTQHRWHVLGDGSLCLFQTETAWTPNDSIGDLIVKAAAWRVEYALVKAGAIDGMTLNGIVSDSSHDAVITRTAVPVSSGSPTNSVVGAP
ncbi:hypothetical protein [Micromonospora sp. WMMD987]|uniref:hypothetical protein n=1 Tax=Micromonospora sp. WMMD987 TaxID=3016089 RepID=UPI00249C8430|nr:hypothetical protein [Micromonospora sp. WMMD987]WFE94515.1 hypothetical protein O7612_24760 [Micromonospora sp. WMMD987]